jgi:hypothetical protein
VVSPVLVSPGNAGVRENRQYGQRGDRRRDRQGLPPYVGAEDDQRDHHARGEPPVEHQAAPARDRQRARRQDDGEDGDEMVVVRADAGDRAAGQPPPRVAGPADPHGDQSQGRAGQEHVGRGVGEVIGAQQHRHAADGDRRQQLGPPGSAELARGEPADDHRGERRQGRPQSQSRQ